MLLASWAVSVSTMAGTHVAWLLSMTGKTMEYPKHGGPYLSSQNPEGRSKQNSDLCFSQGCTVRLHRKYRKRTLAVPVPETVFQAQNARVPSPFLPLCFLYLKL